MIRFTITPIARGCRQAVMVAFLAGLLAADARAADIPVTTTADSGAGSLRQALTQAQSGDRIVFNIPGTPTIPLLSDLPPVSTDISFANQNAIDVTIDRNGFGPLSFTGSQANPIILVINTSGSPSPDADIVASAATTVFGSGAVSGNLEIAGALSPGASPAAGNVGTFDVTGNLDVSSAEVQVDLSTNGGSPSSDLIVVDGIATVTDATLVPSFVGDQFEIGQQFLVLDSTNPIVGSFANQADAFQLPNNPFLEAVQDTSLSDDDFGFLIMDNGLPFTSVVSGCNQTSAAGLLDQLHASATPPTSVLALRNGTTNDVLLAVNQLSGSIYPSLIGAEINHVQMGVESARNMMVRQILSCRVGLVPWIRGYGISGEVDADQCQTVGYRHEVGGIELGCGVGSTYGLHAQIFSHLAFGQLKTRGVDQKANINSYRLGGSLAYVFDNVYVLAAGGGGVQNYDVRRSLSAFEGSSQASSSFDGSTRFGYGEIAYAKTFSPYMAMHYTQVELDSITESGDPYYALRNNGGVGDSLRGILGVAYQKSGCTSCGPATTRLRFGWLHEYLDESETFVSQIPVNSTPVGPLVDQGVSAGRDWGFARVQVDLGTVLNGDLSIAYEGQYNTRSSFNWLLVGWTY